MTDNKSATAWGDRNPLLSLTQQPAGADDQPSPSPAPASMLDLISGKRKDPRGRDWEKRNRAFSYKIPTPLHSAAIQVREDILSVTQFDADGNPRTDGTTSDDVARILVDWALREIQLKPGLLTPRLNSRTRKGQMTVSWEAWDGWDKSPITLKKPVRRQDKNKAEKKCVLTFRWGHEIDARVKKLAGEEIVSKSKTNPLKFTVPVGDLVVRLLQLGVEGYKSHEFNLKISVTAVSKADGWERP